MVSGGRKLRDIPNDGRPDAEIEQPVIPGNGQDENPDAERRVSEAMQYKRGKKETEDYVDSKREPTGTDVLDDLAFFGFMHSQDSRSCKTILKQLLTIKVADPS
jgi:hypothetical protein